MQKVNKSQTLLSLHIKLLCLFLFFFVLNSKIIQLGYVPYDTIEIISCVRSTNYFEQLILWYSLPQSQLNSNLTKIQSQLGITPHIIFNPILRNAMTMSGYALTYSKSLNQLPVKMIWITPTQLPGFYPSCSQFFEFVSVLQKNINKPVGIRAEMADWQWYYRSLNACPQLGIFPLMVMYTQWDSFQPFGGWSSYQMEQKRGFQICGVQAMEIQTRK